MKVYSETQVKVGIEESPQQREFAGQREALGPQKGTSEDGPKSSFQGARVVNTGTARSNWM